MHAHAHEVLECEEVFGGWKPSMQGRPGIGVLCKWYLEESCQFSGNLLRMLPVAIHGCVRE